MKQKDYLTIPELAKMLGVSRIAVYKKVKNGQIKAIKIGRTFGIPKESIANITGTALSDKDKREIDLAVKKTVREYGEVLRLLGKE